MSSDSASTRSNGTFAVKNAKMVRQETAMKDCDSTSNECPRLPDRLNGPLNSKLKRINSKTRVDIAPINAVLAKAKATKWFLETVPKTRMKSSKISCKKRIKKSEWLCQIR